MACLADTPYLFDSTGDSEVMSLSISKNNLGAEGAKPKAIKVRGLRAVFAVFRFCISVAMQCRHVRLQYLYVYYAGVLAPSIPKSILMTRAC
jgi:hypothetical protein